jgi:hypothetical protein
MPPEQLHVIRLWLNEILAEGKPLTRVTEKEMTGKLTLLPKGDQRQTGHPTGDQWYC